MRLTLESIDAAAAALIRKMGFEPTPTGRRQHLRPGQDADDVRAILEEIERAGLSLRGIDVRKPNLEEVFLKLTAEHPRGRCREGAG